MSRLSEVLEVEEEQEFRFDDNLFYKIKGDCLFYRTEDDIWCKSVNGYILCKMIARPERIRIMPPKLQLTKQQITAIKGRIAVLCGMVRL